MGTTALRQLLRSLCQSSLWNYAVFWKLKYQNEVILNWEDGYIDEFKPSEHEEIMFDEHYCSSANQGVHIHTETSICSGDFDIYPIGQVVSSMSHLQYVLGEGLVGEVAYSGNYCWVLYDGFPVFNVNPKFIHEYPTEWMFQFASGIKTILLVPVLPYGVLQLGSLKVVPEDPDVITYIKHMYDLHIAFNFNIAMVSTSDQLKSLLHAHDVLEVSGEDHTETCGTGGEEKSEQLFSLSEVSTPPGHSLHNSQLEMIESELFELPCMEELQVLSKWNKYDIGVSSASVNANLTADPSVYLTKQQIRYEMENDTKYEDLNPFLTFPECSELHKALGPAFQRQTNEDLWKSSFFGEKTCDGSNFTKNDGSETLSYTKEGNSEHLWESMVSDLLSCSDTIFLNGCKSSNVFSEQSAALSQPRSQSEVKSLVEYGPVQWNHGPFESVPMIRKEFSCSASFKSSITNEYDENLHEKGYPNMQSVKGHKLLNTIKRRSRPSDNQKKRPRDRQMIQDRYKELRELVPNGTKCSIDGLLDRTVKHMLYLRSVTDQASKLKQWPDKEVNDGNILRKSEVKKGSQNGRSWAIELGNDLQPCPIVVEDLAIPGHMLIEMLCDEPSLFLEIAQLIKGFGLTILKGIMESRENEKWAHFIVEATITFHRLDIFWPLMQLLQRKRKTIPSKI